MFELRTPIVILDDETVTERVESGLMVPMHAGSGLRIVDCSDDRGVTSDFYELRLDQFGADISPGRYFGAVTGIASTAIIAFAAEHGDRAVTQFVKDYTPEGFVDFAANISDRAHQLDSPIEINQHSDDTKEQNTLELRDHKVCDEPLGCKLATSLGAVLLGATQPWQINETRNVIDAVGIDLPLEAATEGMTIIRRHIPKDFGIHRGALHHAQTRSSRYTPIAIHEGKHAPNEQAKLVIDMAGFRSNANRHNQNNLPRYHHTPGLAVEILAQVIPEVHLDPRITEAVGLLLAQSTRLALSGNNTPTALGIEIIPQELSQVA